MRGNDFSKYEYIALYANQKPDFRGCTVVSQLQSWWKLLRGNFKANTSTEISLQSALWHDWRATKFAANDEWGKVYKKLFGVTEMNQPLSVLTGASAGATESFVVVPFELVKIRLQDKASAGKYTGMIDVIQKTIKAEGVLAMYNGLESTLWRHVVWNAGYFGVIYQVKSLLPKQETKKGQMLNDLIAGSIGGTFGTMLNTPYVP